MNWRQFVDNSPTNQYGEKAASVVTHVDDGVLLYRCRDDAWAAAHKHWRDARRTDRSAPQPMPAGHCMFVSPLSYGCVVEGESREHVIAGEDRPRDGRRQAGRQRPRRCAVCGLHRKPVRKHT